MPAIYKKYIILTILCLSFAVAIVLTDLPINPVKAESNSLTDYAEQGTTVRGTSYTSLTKAAGALIAEDKAADNNDLSVNEFAQSAKFTLSGATTSDFFGSGVAIDGDTAVVTATSINVGPVVDQGAAYVFVRRGLNWSLQQRLVASDGAFADSFGSAVAIQGDTIIVTAILDDEGANTNQGSAYVFTRSGTVWTQQQKIIAADGEANSYFGSSVAINNETLIIGSFNSNVATNDHQGAAYVYVRSGATWTQQTKLTASDGALLAYFGSSVALDGDYAIIGAPEAENGTGFRHGAAYIFRRIGTTWTQQQKLTVTDAFELGGERFGIAVGISGDTAVAGAWEQLIGEQSNQGAAYVFVRNGTTWTRQAMLISNDGTRYDSFGKGIVIKGEDVFVGSTNSDIGANTSQGAVYIFTRQNSIWTQRAKLIATDGGTSNYFGEDLAVSDGTILIGSSGWGGGKGAAYTFLNTTWVPDLQAASDSGLSNADNITNQRVLSFDITDINIGSNIELLRDGVIAASGVAGGNSITLTDNSVPANGNFRYAAQMRVGGEIVWRGTPTFVTVDTDAPSATMNQTSGQADPTRFLPVSFTATFSEPVFGFNAADVTLAGSTANVSSADFLIAGSGTTYTVAVSNITSNGQVVQAGIPTGVVEDEAGNLNFASTSTDNTITLDNIAPTVTINQAAGQQDPAQTQPVNFTVNFSEAVTGFTNADISLSTSTANVSSANIAVTGSGTTYNVAISNVTSRGRVTARVLANAVQDSVGIFNTASTSSDNTVTLGSNTLFDFDGDGKTDVSIYRPSVGQWWYQHSSDNSVKALEFGSSTDKIVPADYDGDNKTDIAFWRPSTGEWFVLRSSNLTFFAAPFGASSDTPAPGDFDSDGKADFTVFRAGAGTWFINKTTGGVDIVSFGTNGDMPVVADYDADGKTDIAIFRPTGGSGQSEWWILRSVSGLFATPFGSSTDKAVPADYTGDRKADVAFWRPSTGVWFVLRSENLTFFAAPFGANGDVPVAGDYDGDGRADFAVFRQSSATWFVQKSTGGTLIQGFGTNGDIPVPFAYVP